MSKKFTITKTIDFCYGHRLLNHDGKCRHLHGHNGSIEISLATDKLDERGMAYDFSDVKKQVKGWIDENLDHRMLLNKNDPLGKWLQEKGEPIFFFESNPTAENIAKLIFEETKKLGFDVVSVRLWETPNSSATYKG